MPMWEGVTLGPSGEHYKMLIEQEVQARQAAGMLPRKYEGKEACTADEIMRVGLVKIRKRVPTIPLSAVIHDDRVWVIASPKSGEQVPFNEPLYDFPSDTLLTQLMVLE